MTAVRVLPSPRDDAAWDADTVRQIAFWTHVDPTAHALAHPDGQVQGCPGCTQPAVCRWCAQTPDGCPDWAGHDVLDRSSDLRHLAATR